MTDVVRSSEKRPQRKKQSAAHMRNQERLAVDEKHRARSAIALLALARGLIVAADREGPRGDMRLFVTTRPICKQLESLETQLAQFIDTPWSTP